MVALPTLQAEFGVAHAASLPCTFVMIGFATGAVLLGRPADHFGVPCHSESARPCLSNRQCRRSTAYSAGSGQDCTKCRWHERSSGLPRSARWGSLSATILRDQRSVSASVLFIVASGPDGLAVHRQSKKRLERLVRQFHDRVRPRLDARELRRGLRQHALHEEARGNEFSLHPSVRLLG